MTQLAPLLALIGVGFLIAAGGSAGAAAIEEGTPLSPERLDSLRQEVRTTHPAAAAARARVLAAEAATRGVRLWEDPTAGVSYMAAEREMQKDDGDLMFSLEQMLPRRGLQAAQKAMAGAEQAMAQAEARATQLNLETLVGRAAIELALADELLVIETNQLAWLETMAINAREMLKNPMANASEPLRIEAELAMEQQRVEAVRRERLRLRRQLNLLLGRPVEEPWPTLRLPSAGPAPELESLLARLPEANPMLQALRNSTEAARAAVTMARRERSPIFSVGVETAVYSGGDFRQATVGARMTIPWINGGVYRAATDRARHREASAAREADALAQTMRGELVAAHTEAENAAREARTFAGEILPRTEKAADATRIAWLSSKAGLLEVLDAQRALLNARLSERRAVAAHHAAQEKLRSIVPPAPQP